MRRRVSDRPVRASRSFHSTALTALILLLMASTLACRSLPTAGDADLEELQGYWEGQGPGGEISISIAGNRLRYAQPTADPEDEEFWYETTFELLTDIDPKQLHATILANSSPGEPHLGTVVVTIFQIEDGTLSLGVIEDYLEPPSGPVVGEWVQARDRFFLQRAQPRDGRPSAPTDN